MFFTYVNSGYTPPFSPPDLGNLALWLDASDAGTITQVSGSVSQWSDKSGNSRDLSQVIGTNQPTTGVSTLNGKNTIRFSTDDYMTRSSFVYDQGMATVFIVLSGNTQSSESWYFIESSTSNNSPAYGISSGNGSPSNKVRPFYRLDSNGQVFNVSSTSVALSGTGVAITWRDSGSREDAYINGGSSAVGSDYTRGTTTVNTFSLGAYVRGTVSGYITADFAEVIIYSSYLSASDTNLVGAYLASKWGTTWTNI